MKRISVSLMIAFLILAAGSVSIAQEQQKGKPLVFPKEMVDEDRPSDLHMGSDPYYEQEKHKYEGVGSDEEGYPAEYDPQMQYYEKKTKVKKTDEKK